MRIKALYEDGLFRPEQPVDLEPGSRVELEVREAPRPRSASELGPPRPDETRALTDLEREVLKAVQRQRNGVDFAGILEEVGEWVEFHNESSDSRIGFEAAEVKEVVRCLHASGYFEEVLTGGKTAVYSLTPRGWVVAILNRRERWRRHKRKPPRPLPMPEHVCSRFEDLAVDFMGVGKRTRNALKKAGVTTAGALTRMMAKELAQLEGIGRRSIEMIELELGSMGLDLRPAAKRKRRRPPATGSSSSVPEEVPASRAERLQEAAAPRTPRQGRVRSAPRCAPPGG